MNAYTYTVRPDEQGNWHVWRSVAGLPAVHFALVHTETDALELVAAMRNEASQPAKLSEVVAMARAALQR